MHGTPGSYQLPDDLTQLQQQDISTPRQDVTQGYMLSGLRDSVVSAFHHSFTKEWDNRDPLAVSQP